MRVLLWLTICLAAQSFAADVRTGVYLGRTVRFHNLDGLAVYQGDIILGTTAEVEQPASAGGKQPQSSITPLTTRLWAGGRIPYTVDTTLSASLQQRINDAITHWNTKTLIKFNPRGSESNYVRFTTSTSTVSCSSNVGMIGGQQLIRLPDGCGTGAIIHEMGHSVGFWHEQERLDRNQFVTVLFENIDKSFASNYDQVFASGKDAGPYNFNSIMHYGAFDFSSDGILPAMETVPAGIPVGQRAGLSAGDLDTVQRMYGAAPKQTVISTTPSGLKVLVDGALVDDNTSFDWPPGTAHRVEMPFQGDTSIRFVFGSWSDGGAVAHSFTASADTTVLLANFVRQRHLSFVASPLSGGTAQAFPSPADGFFTERSNIQLTAVPAAGFSFLQWNLTPSRSLNPKFYTVAASGTISAQFSTGIVSTVTSDPIGRTVFVDSTTFSTPTNFAWLAGSSHTVDVDTTQPNFVHYQFTGWSDGGARAHTVQATAKPQTFTANFTTQYQLTVNFSGAAGTVTTTPSSADTYYDAGTSIQLSARPNGALLFGGWTGDLGGTTNPITFSMDEEKLIGATFVSSIPAITAVSSASGLTGAVSPGEIIVIYGTNLGPSNLQRLEVAGGKVTTTLGGTQVLFDGKPGAMIYTSAGQVSAIVPYGLVIGRTLTLQVTFNGKPSATIALNTADTAPALFTFDSSGKGAVAALNQNGSVNTPSNPAHRGDIIVLYSTGEGATNPAGVDGQVASSVYPKPVAAVTVRIGGQPAVVHYAGAAPTFVAGVLQINAQIPDGIRTGNVPIQIIAGTNASPSEITLAVQ